MFTIFRLQTKVTSMKTYQIFVAIDQFLHDLQTKQMLRQTDKQTLNYQKARRLTMVPPKKEDFSNKKQGISEHLFKNYRRINIKYIYIYIHRGIV